MLLAKRLVSSRQGVWYKLCRFRLAYIMILPATIGMLLVHFIPMLWGVYISFRDYNKFTIRKAPWEVKFVALDHYIRAIKHLDKGFLQSLRVTLSFTIISIVMCVVLGLGAALIANRSFRGRTIFRGLMLIPYILPGVVYLTTLRFMFTHDGIINKILVNWLGLVKEPIFWLVGKNTFWTIVIGNVWGRWPLFFITFLAALQTIPRELYEAAAMDGASIWQQFRYITLPYLRSVGVIVIMLNTLWSFNQFLVPFIMLGGGYSVVPEPATLLSVEILRESFNNLNFGYGAAEAVLMTLVSLIFVIVYLRRTRPQAVEEMGKQEEAKSLRWQISTWVIGGMLGLLLVIVLGKSLLKISAVLAGVILIFALIWAALRLAERLAVRVFFYCGLIFYLTLVLFPLYWLVSSSLKIESEIRETTLIPRILAWQNYIQVWRDVPLARYFINSALISGCAMILAVSIATLAGYAISRFRFPGREFFSISILSTQMFPGILFLLPYFLIFTMLQRTALFTEVLGGFKFIGEHVYWGNILLMIITYTAFVMPFAVWVVRGFMDSIPTDLEEAARVDGCSHFQAFLRIVLPLALPGIATIAILAFMKGWNEVLFSSVLTNPLTRTVALGIQDFRTQQTVKWNLTMAAGVLISAPVTVFFTTLQRYMVSGLTAGAVKG